MFTRATEEAVEPVQQQSFDAAVGTRAASPGFLRRLRARLSRPRSPVWPLALYAVLAVWVMHPFFPKSFRVGGDLFVVLGTITEAENALREGQFPIRVAPTQLDGTRYPFFQFYGQFPYTLTAAADLVLPGNMYSAWREVAGALLVFGAFYAYRLSYQFTRRVVPSVVAGAVFMTAPYLFADLGARGAFTEFVAVNLMPAVYFYAWRAFVAPRWRYVLRSALAWTLLGLSHNVSFLYGVVFAGLLFLSLVRFDTKYVRRLLRVAIGGLLALAMVAYYVAPQLMLLSSFVIHDWPNDPMQWVFLTGLRDLLSPTAYTDPASSTPDLTLQIGLPLMLGVVLSVLAIALPGRRRGRLLAPRVLCLFALAFFVVWSPVNFWQYLPKLLAMVQFPYRVLMFVMLFGALLTAFGLTQFGRRAALAPLALVGFATVGYVALNKSYDPAAVRAQIERPVIGGLDDYLLTTDTTALTSAYHPEVNFADWEFGLTRDGKPPYSFPSDHWLIRLPWAVMLPTPPGATSIVLEGELPARGLDGEPFTEPGWNVEFHLDVGTTRHAVPIKPGPFRVVAPLGQPGGAPVRVNMIATVVQSPRGPFNTACRLHRVYFDPPGQADRALVSAAALKDQIRYGRPSKLRIDVARPSLVQLPVLYYPKLMSVRVDGRPAAYGNLGRFLAVPLEPDRHTVEAAFTGLSWANGISLVGWFIALSGLLIVAARSFRDRRPIGPRVRPSATGPEFGWREFAASLMFLIVGIGAGRAAPAVVHHFDRSFRVEVSADREAGGEQSVSLAFDGNPATFWASPGGLDPATLTIRPNRPAKLVRIELEARQTSLFEAWKRVRVTLYHNGSRALEREFTFPDADHEPVETIALPPTPADRIELRFSDPVTLTRVGRRVEANAVSPGYREIRLTWEGEVVGKK